MKTFILIGTEADGTQKAIADPSDYATVDALLDEITGDEGLTFCRGEHVQFERVDMYPLGARCAYKRRKFRMVPAQELPPVTEEDDD